MRKRKKLKSLAEIREARSKAALLSKGRAHWRKEEWPEPPPGMHYCLDCSEEAGEPTAVDQSEFYLVKGRNGQKYPNAYCKRHARIRTLRSQAARREKAKSEANGE